MAENNVLAKTYSEVALELLEGMKPDEEIVNTVVNDVFNGHLPSSLLESFYFDLMLLKWEINEVKKQSVKTGSLCRQNNAYKKVWLHIRELKERHSTYCLDIDVLAANLVAMKNPSNACKWWKETIDKAIGKDKYRIALTSAGYATEIGYIFEAKDMLQACYDDGFALLNIGERCVLLNELANTMELCGTRFEMSKIWNESLALSEGTELQSKIYFSQAICAYNRSDYATALYLIDKCLKHYKPESSIYDETMASILTYRSICLSQEHQWSEAVIDIRNAMVFWPDLSDLSSFNLFYDLAFYCIAQHQWNDAKQALEKIKAMAGLGLDDGQKQQIEDMYAILRMPLERRVPYVQTYYGDSFT